MRHSLQGKTVLVPAAGNGIGHATAAARAERGATVVATPIDAAAIEDPAGHLSGFATGQASAIEGGWSI